MGDAPSFGQWLRDRRKARDLTQEQLAERVNVATETIRKYEKGTRRPSADTARLLAEFFRVPEEEWPALVQFARLGEETDESVSLLATLSTLPQTTTRQVLKSDKPSTNLPVYQTSFIGRDMQVGQVRSLLQNGARLITLTGPPGIGKSRLSFEVAWGLIERFPDGVFVVPLSPVADPGMVAGAIAQALDVKDTSSSARLEVLKQFLADKRMLLVLDNFEHIMPAAPLLVDLLAACPSLCFIVSSREALHLYGEQQFAVPSMDLPDAQAAQGQDLEEMSSFEAVQLFVQRARAARPEFELTERNGPVVVEICRRLDALPLAIELAAARTRLLPPEALLARLDDTLGLLTTGPTDLPSRHQTLRGAIEWSYSLLQDDEKAVLRAMSAFVDGCTLDALESAMSGDGPLPVASVTPGLSGHPDRGFSSAELAILTGDSGLRAAGGRASLRASSRLLDILTSLLDKSLMGQSEVAGEPRFSMLWTIREYGLERLQESGEGVAVRSRHALYFLDLAQTAEPGLTSGERAYWLQRLDKEHFNLLAALEWCSSPQADPEIGLRLAGALGWYWYFRGYFNEGRHWLAAMLKRAGDLRTGALAAKALNAAGRLAFFQDDYERTRPLLEESVMLWRQTGEKRGLAYALTNMGIAVVFKTRDIEEGGHLLINEALSLFRDVGDKWGLAYALDAMGDAVGLLGFPNQQVIDYEEESLAYYQEANDKWGVAGQLIELGHAALRDADYETAQTRFEESMHIERAIGDKWSLGQSMLSLGLIAWYREDYARASQLFSECYSIFQQLGDRLRMALALKCLGHIARDEGEIVEAAELYQKSLSLACDLRNSQNIALGLAAMAGIAAARGRFERAAALYAAADALREASRGMMPPMDLAGYTKGTALVQGSLDQEKLAAATEQGRAMTVEQAANLARRP